MWNAEIENFSDFLLYHHTQLEFLKVPFIFWEELYRKCKETIFDAGDVFSFEEVESYSENDVTLIEENIGWKVSVISENGISSMDGTQIYLIDHAYTYTLQNVALDLLDNENVRNRTASIMNISTSCSKKEDIVSEILAKMWRFCQPYVYGTGEASDDLCTVWYIMDELGIRIRHSVDPTFRTVPFFYVGDRLAYTLLFPIKCVKYGDEVTRNYVEGQYTDELSYKAAILPWEYHSLLDIDCNPTEPHVDFIQSGRVKESVPDVSHITESPVIVRDRKLKVFCEYDVIKLNLKHPAFEFTDNEAEADVLWLNYHFKEYKELWQHPHKFVNQFPNEHILTSKDLLAVVCRRTACGDCLNKSTLDTYPAWLPTTYNLKTELPKFVSYFQQRERKGLENYWICKPWNRARGADMQITNDLNCIVRLSNTCPKIACKYITDPVLFPIDHVGLVKMDIRYIIILKAAKPVELYAYKNFWLRFANKPFSLDSFEDYEKHFTVMNYNQCNLKQMYCTEFIEKFENCYPEYKWSIIEAQIFNIFKEVFRGATSYPPPAGLFNNPQSRAMYGVDMMLQWDRKSSDKPQIQPVILEINWAPDCQRACQYYPEFFDDVFEVMFLNEGQNPNVVLL